MIEREELLTLADRLHSYWDCCTEGGDDHVARRAEDMLRRLAAAPDTIVNRVAAAPAAGEAVAHMRRYDINGEERDELCDEGEPGAFPVYAAPPPQAALPGREEIAALIRGGIYGVGDAPFGGGLQDKTITNTADAILALLSPRASEGK